MALLVQFLLRLTFGLAIGMAITSPKQVTSGYYRNHLYVALGLSALAAMLSRSVATAAFWPAVCVAGLCYIGSVAWLYEKHELGRGLLLLTGAISLCGTWLLLDQQGPPGDLSDNHWVFALSVVASASSGLTLGITLATMLLGHWYLNSPTMELAPLRRLILAMAVATSLQTVVAALGLYGECSTVSALTTQWLLFVAMRWAFGLIGVAVLIWMAWQTVKIPNTQSATGILYVAVIGTFVGETMSLLLSSESLFPL